MRNVRKETLAEHTLETAFIAHALAVIENKRFGGNYEPEKAALFALFHDVPEIITGDLPTPIKYYNEDIKNIYSEIESAAADRLINLLPEDLRSDYQPLFYIDDEKYKKIVKAADKLSALIKCRDEMGMGNNDFSSAEKSTLKSIKKLGLPSVEMFLKEFTGSFSLPIDEQK